MEPHAKNATPNAPKGYGATLRWGLYMINNAINTILFLFSKKKKNILIYYSLLISFIINNVTMHSQFYMLPTGDISIQCIGLKTDGL